MNSARDRFELRVFFTTNPLARWETTRALLETLVQEAGDLAPTTFQPRYDKKIPLTMETVERHFRRGKPPDSLVFTSELGIGVRWTGYPQGHSPGSKLMIRIPFALLGTRERTERVLSLAKALCELCPPVYGWGHSEEDIRLADDPHATDAGAPLDLRHVYWLTILGAEMVESFGRSRVAAAPAYRVELLDNGSALLVSSALPNECLSPEAREAQARALAHLRPDLPAGDTLPALLERSGKLQPVEPSWHPNVAELFRMIVEAVPLAERRAKELELSAHEPPPVTEWRATPEALPADVDDVAAAVDSYHRKAQTFSAGHHNELPGVMNAEPDSLVQIDGYFYFRDNLRNNPAALERLMVPTLGAYLGTMFERLLDGQWIPRRNLQESQIVVGDRAWLPFLRVKRFLQSKQAVIDYSLTSYYREAERQAANLRGADTG